MIDRVTIRMYEVGFGDCFLLTFWTGTHPAHVLVDCGSITEGKAKVSAVAKDVIRACTAAGQPPRIALVVATHRHRDHVGGFDSSAWSSVEVGEVWMPWTEDPKDPVATQLRNRQSAIALALVGSATDDEPLAAAVDAKESAAQALQRSVRAMSINALTNEAAMSTLHRGFVGSPPRHFLPLDGVDCEARTVAGLDGVSIHVLGPPRSQAAIAVMNPPTGEAYSRLRGGSLKVANEEGAAFGSEWAVASGVLPADDRKTIDGLALQPEGGLAAAIDNAVNNTSLILVFEVGNQWLLFPGDAQWGAWNAALVNPKALEILARTTLYKVGHHGSHNATPRKLIETVMTQLYTAMFSTKPVPQWPDIPRQPLLDAIQARHNLIVRTDREAEAPPGVFRVSPGLYIERELSIVPPQLA